MPTAYRNIPYGVANFYDIRANNNLFIDKTRFIPLLEQYQYVFFIRPRRFGKSCWIETLSEYYDRSRAHRFDLLFGDLDIGKNPTDERNAYVILQFDFSMIDDRFEPLEQEFEGYVHQVLEYAMGDHPDLFSQETAQKILSQATSGLKINELFFYAGKHSIPIYVLIDEYDNFANTILAQRGEEAYHSFTHGEGFYRNFEGLCVPINSGGGIMIDSKLIAGGGIILAALLTMNK